MIVPPPPPAPPPALVAPAPDFQGIDFLVGGMWVAVGAPVPVCETIERTLDGHFLTSTQVSISASSAVIARGFLGVDASVEGGRLLSVVFTTGGAFFHLRQVPPRQPDAWTFEGERLAGGRVDLLRQTLIRDGPDQLRTRSEVLVDGKWVPSGEITYRRSR